MNKSSFFSGQPIFSQLFSFIPKQLIYNAILEHKSDRYVKKFDTLHHLISMLYCCYQGCTSLREVVTGLHASQGRLQSLNMKFLPARSTLAEANKRRCPEVFEKIYMGILSRHQHLLSDSHSTDRLMKRSVIIDSTTISLFQEILLNAGRPSISGKKKGGIKVHMAINASQDVPYLIRMTAAAKADSPFMKEITPPAGSIVIMDRGYNNFHQLNRWKKTRVDWITRLRSNNVITVQENLKTNPAQNILSDQHIVLGFKNKHIEQVKCRLIRYYDVQSKRVFEFITSNKRLGASKIAMLYKQRMTTVEIKSAQTRFISVISVLSVNPSHRTRMTRI